MSRTPELFDIHTRDLRRRRASGGNFLLDEIILEAQERRITVNRTFSSPAVVSWSPAAWRRAVPDAHVVPDHDTLDLAPQAHDLVIHGNSLHLANDPVGQLIQCRRALMNDGLFLGFAFGGQTLNELRSALAATEIELTGGMSPRVVPMGEIRDLGGLLQRAGFALPVADSFTLKASYPDLLSLAADLRSMGETNCLSERHRAYLGKAFLRRAEEIYRQNYAEETGRLLATFEVIVLTGWAPDESQPQPLRPGSAAQRLADALGTNETPLPRQDD